MMRKVALVFLEKQLGTPYLYGSNGAGGYDCSALIAEALKSVGLLPRGDYSAQSIYDYFAPRSPISTPKELLPGTIIFYGETAQKISHIAMVYTAHAGTIYIIEAGGGDSTTTTFEEARRKGAMVRIRPLHARTDFVGLIDPF